ncbi:hypothetical protein EV126DRAFT_254154 [Verticillium dahliae]|nr:hypothetical protein EV126DRAFT_254154 [Verticillium dahliae]
MATRLMAKGGWKLARSEPTPTRTKQPVWDAGVTHQGNRCHPTSPCQQRNAMTTPNPPTPIFQNLNTSTHTNAPSMPTSKSLAPSGPLSTHYLRPSTSGQLTARARTTRRVQRGPRLAHHAGVHHGNTRGGEGGNGGGERAITEPPAPPPRSPFTHLYYHLLICLHTTLDTWSTRSARDKIIVKINVGAYPGLPSFTRPISASTRRVSGNSPGHGDLLCGTKYCDDRSKIYQMILDLPHEMRFVHTDNEFSVMKTEPHSRSGQSLACRFFAFAHGISQRSTRNSTAMLHVITSPTLRLPHLGRTTPVSGKSRQPARPMSSRSWPSIPASRTVFSTEVV